MVASGNSVVLDNEGSTGYRESHAKGVNVVNVDCNEYDMGWQSLEICNDLVAADYSLGVQNESSALVSSTAKGNEGHKNGELIRDDGENINVNENATQNAAINCFRTINREPHQAIRVTKDTPDDRNIS
jgi:hypothetical protein